MTWDEAQKAMDAGKTVTLPENKDLFHLVKKDGKLFEQALSEDGTIFEAELEDIYGPAKDRTDWEEIVE